MESTTLYQVIFLIWIIGSTVFVAVQIVRYFTAKRKILRWSVESKQQKIEETLLSLSREMKIKTTIYPMINKEVTSPMIMGLVRPVLMLPHENYEINDLAFILRHELTHFKNKDIVYKVLLFIANANHWFNPLVYLMVREAHADMERVCDDYVLKNRGAEERREYGEVILNSIGQRKMRGNVFTTNFYASTSKIKARFVNIMDMRKKKSGFAQLLAMAFAAVIFSGISPVMGYSVSRDTTNIMHSNYEQTRSYRFASMVIDMQGIYTLEIYLQNCNLVVLRAEYWALPDSQMRIVSNPAFSHSLTINHETRTAYIYNLSSVPSNNTHGLPDSLTIGVSTDLGWTFERVNIHLENGNLRYLDVPVEDFLAKDLNINLVRGVIEEHIAVAPRTGRE
jgi:beta-lactamase regulating signal transducer with metallopeptidase domain